MIASALLLDLDRAASSSLGDRLGLLGWEHPLRFGCSRQKLLEFSDDLHKRLPYEHGPVLLGSGDFHHLTLPLLQRSRSRRLRVIVFDNHPDNMLFPFGVHCGSWVRLAARLDHVEHIYMMGMTSEDMTKRQAWSHYLEPLRAGKLSYWTVGTDTTWMNQKALGHARRDFAHPDELLAACQELVTTHPMDTYLSIDKDVLDPCEVVTNWDQGRMRLASLIKAIDAMAGQIVGADITGELSQAHYRQWWKRALSALDGQSHTYSAATLAALQSKQHLCNTRLLRALNASWR